MRCFFLGLLCILLSGCTEYLVPTPYVMYGERGRAVFAQVPEPLRTSEVKVFYVTDRGVDRTSERGPEYGYGRATGFVYSIATVQLGENVSWDELVADTTSATRTPTYVPKVTRIEELGQFPPVMLFTEARDRRLVLKPTAVVELIDHQDAITRAMRPLIDQTDRKDAIVFIHGFNNSFDDAVVRITQAWHFGGRQGIPIAYT